MSTVRLETSSGGQLLNAIAAPAALPHLLRAALEIAAIVAGKVELTTITIRNSP